jgi:hypothetical protein
MGEDRKAGALLALVTLAIEALAVLPGRVALGRTQQSVGRSPVEFAIAGTFRDVSDLALPVGLAVLLVLGALLLLRRSAAEERASARAMRGVLGFVALVGVLLWFASAAAAEFKIQRGVDATWFDMEIASRWDNSVGTFIGFVLLRRHFVPGALALSAACAVLALAWRRSRALAIRRRAGAVIAFAVVTVAGWGLALLPLDPHVHVFRTIADRNVVGEPFPNLFASFGRSHGNVRLGMRGLITHASFPAGQAGGGSRLLGVPDGPSTDCSAHPMARLLPIAGSEPVRARIAGSHELDPSAARVLVLLDALSAEIYAGRSAPIDLWQLMLESYRGDDIHAIHPRAPRELAPFTNALYENAAGARSVGFDGAVVAVRRMWQSGARTSQGLSSYMCGMGMMPYGLSFTRDFGPLPVRCLPDLLVDGGFEPFFFYGGTPSFDGMDDFFRHHGFRRIIGRLQQSPSSPTSEGGVSDRALLAHAVEVAAASPRDHGRYFLVMSSSNHVPYRRPDDVPDEVDARVNAVESAPGYVGSADDGHRLRTFAYADAAVAELFARLGPARSRSIVVLGADHATVDPFVWESDPPAEGWSRDHASGVIPFAIVLPDALVAESARPDRVRAIARDLNGALGDHAWSQNDTPLLVLALLAHAPAMTALAPERRWHTLGGQRTSPFFVPPEVAGDPGAPGRRVVVMGIDAGAKLFGVDDDSRQVLPAETASFVRSAEEIYTMSPTLMPVASAMCTFLNGYAERCGARP